ncbi:hypothetical protein [Streptomyces fodineus]|uniref:hypothetical protein n=1 Tax=Streptomyces fodineus TaxID=1904616 RepID=UPI001D054755|nr:hypothetical protein [Streptomyces fodineus]
MNHHTGQGPSPTLQRWTDRQRTRWNTLHPQQQHLLTTIGITPDFTSATYPAPDNRRNA